MEDNSIEFPLNLNCDGKIVHEMASGSGPEYMQDKLVNWNSEVVPTEVLSSPHGMEDCQFYNLSVPLIIGHMLCNTYRKASNIRAT